MNTIKTTLLLSILCFISAGCENNEVAQANNTAKWNAYVDAYNGLNGNISTINYSASHFQQEQDNLNAAKAGDFTKIKESKGVKYDRDQLQTARDLPGDFLELDQSANEIITLIDTYLPDWKRLEEYNSTLRYQADGGVQGKKLLTSYLALQEKLPALYEQFQTKIEAVSLAQKKAQIENFKKSGDTFRYHLYSAIQSADDIVQIIGKQHEAGSNQGEQMQQADAWLALIEQQLEPLRNQIDSQADKKQFNATQHGLVIFVRNYREYKNTPNDENYKRLAFQYNDIITRLNMANQY